MIKFRVWSKDLSKYRKLDDISNDQGLGMFFEVQNGIGSNVTSIFYSINDVVEQFTGLKDVNGQDIYEGDIVSVFNEDGSYYNDVIEWCIKYDYPAFELKYHSHLYESNALSEIMNAGVENIKVIGNIHDNPELLEAEK